MPHGLALIASAINPPLFGSPHSATIRPLAAGAELSLTHAHHVKSPVPIA
jgi:hypothetical protein